MVVSIYIPTNNAYGFTFLSILTNTCYLYLSLFKKMFLNIYLFLRNRERHSMSRVAGERERETQNLKQAPGSELSAQSPMRGSYSQT